MVRFRNAGGQRILVESGSRMRGETCCCVCGGLVSCLRAREGSQVWFRDVELTITGIANGTCDACDFALNGEFIASGATGSIWSASGTYQACAFQKFTATNTAVCAGDSAYINMTFSWVDTGLGDSQLIVRWINALTGSAIVQFKLQGTDADDAFIALCQGDEVEIPRDVSVTSTRCDITLAECVMRLS